MSDGPYKKVPMSVRRKEDHECTREEYNDKWSGSWNKLGNKLPSLERKKKKLGYAIQGR